MIEQSIYLAAAANFVWMLPAYQNAIKSKQEREYIQQGRVFTVPESKAERPECDGHETVWTNPAVQFSDYGYKYYNWVESNWFNRKPFTCLFCLSFWISVISLTISVILSVVFDEPSVDNYLARLSSCVVAPVIAVAFRRWFDSLPVNL